MTSARLDVVFVRCRWLEAQVAESSSADPAARSRLVQHDAGWTASMDARTCCRYALLPALRINLLQRLGHSMQSSNHDVPQSCVLLTLNSVWHPAVATGGCGANSSQRACPPVLWHGRGRRRRSKPRSRPRRCSMRRHPSLHRAALARNPPCWGHCRRRRQHPRQLWWQRGACSPPSAAVMRRGSRLARGQQRPRQRPHWWLDQQAKYAARGLIERQLRHGITARRSSTQRQHRQPTWQQAPRRLAVGSQPSGSLC